VYPAKRGKPPLPGVPGLLHVVVVVGVQVQGARQGGHRGQRQAHCHPVWEPWQFWSWSWNVSVAADVFGEVVVGSGVLWRWW